jgi:hypothetical protein
MFVGYESCNMRTFGLTDVENSDEQWVCSGQNYTPFERHFFKQQVLEIVEGAGLVNAYFFDAKPYYLAAGNKDKSCVDL